MPVYLGASSADITLLLSVKRQSLEGWRELTKHQPAHLSWFLWNTYKGQASFPEGTKYDPGCVSQCVFQHCATSMRCYHCKVLMEGRLRHLLHIFFFFPDAYVYINVHIHFSTSTWPEKSIVWCWMVTPMLTTLGHAFLKGSKQFKNFD